MLHDSYVGRGLQPTGSAQLRVTPQHLLAESMVFVACEAGEVVGTVTITGDSPVHLPLDKDYPEPIARLRGSGARLAEIGSLAVHRRHRHRHLATALGALSLSGCEHVLGATHVVIGINPSVESYYRAVWGFGRLGAPRHHAELYAPVVGMQVRREGLAERFFARRYSRRRIDGRPVASLMEPWSCFDDAMGHRLSRRAFRRLFAERSDALYALEPEALRYLATQRSPETLRAG